MPQESLGLLEIERHCYILSVTVRAFRGNYQVKGAEVTVDGDKVESELVSKPQWKLFEKWNKKLAPYESKIRKIVYETSVTFRDGVYIVPKSKAGDMIRRVYALRDEYQAEVKNLVHEWDDLLVSLSSKVPSEVWRTVSARLPKKEALETMYGVDVSLWSSGSSEAAIACLDAIPGLATEVETLDMESLRRKMPTAQFEVLTRVVRQVQHLKRQMDTNVGRLIEDGVGDWLGEVKATTSRVVNSAVQAMLEGPAQEFSEALENMEGIMSRGGTCRTATLDAVRRAYEKLKGFSFMVPTDLLQRMHSVERSLRSISAEEVNQSRPSASILVESLREIRQELDTEVQDLQSRRGFRRAVLV